MKNLDANIQELEIKEGGNKIPSFLKVLGFVELWERFSYYGMRALLVLYLISFLKLSDTSAYNLYALFGTFAYVGCVLFGYLSDKYMGARNTVLTGAMIMLIGHGFMAFSHLEGYTHLVFMALAMICIGTSAFKGNITNILGMCYKGTPYNKDVGFTMFYVAINLGSAVAANVCGYLGQSADWGWGWGFGAAAIGMTFAVLVLKLFEQHLGNAGSMPEQYAHKKYTVISLFLIGILGICYLASLALLNADIIMKRDISVFGYYFNWPEIIFPWIVLWYGIEAFKDAAYRINGLILFIIVTFTGAFYVLEMQLGGLLKVFVDRNVNLDLSNLWQGLHLKSSMVESINPIVIVVFGTFLGISKLQDNEKAFYRFLLGLAAIPTCFAILYSGCFNHVDGLVPFVYVLMAFVVMAMGETIVGPMMQSQLSKLANPAKRGLTFGFANFFLGLANVIGGRVASTFAIDTTQAQDKLTTLEVYKQGFLEIVMYNMVIIVAFIVLLPILRNSYRKIMLSRNLNSNQSTNFTLDT